MVTNISLHLLESQRPYQCQHVLRRLFLIFHSLCWECLSFNQYLELEGTMTDLREAMIVTLTQHWRLVENSCQLNINKCRREKVIIFFYLSKSSVGTPLTNDRLTREKWTGLLTCIIHVHMKDTQGKMSNSKVWLELEFI